jgi:hypothetical protein
MQRTCAAVLALSLACCATSKPSAASTPASAISESVPQTWEPWPPEPSAAPAVAADSGPIVRLEAREGGYTIRDLFDLVAAKTGRPLMYDSTNQTFKAMKVEFVGSISMPLSKLFPWFQAVLAYRKLVLIPVGPVLADGQQAWYVIDQADPSLRSRPMFVDEQDVPSHADRDGLFIVTELRVRDTVDTSRARAALQQLITQTAGIGRVQEAGRFLVVADFAPVVASIKRLLDRINAETPPSAAMRPVTPAK